MSCARELLKKENVIWNRGENYVVVVVFFLKPDTRTTGGEGVSTALAKKDKTKETRKEKKRKKTYPPILVVEPLDSLSDEIARGQACLWSLDSVCPARAGHS